MLHSAVDQQWRNGDRGQRLIEWSDVAARYVGGVQTRWETRQGWYDHDLEFTGTKLIYKQWFDSGKDPNRYEATVPEFLAGAIHAELREACGDRVLGDIIDTVTSLTSGGPAVAEPPD